MCRFGTRSVACGSLDCACLFSGGEASNAHLQAVRVGSERRNGRDLRPCGDPGGDGGGRRSRLRPRERREAPAPARGRRRRACPRQGRSCRRRSADQEAGRGTRQGAPQRSEGHLDRQDHDLSRVAGRAGRGVGDHEDRLHGARRLRHALDLLRSSSGVGNDQHRARPRPRQHRLDERDAAGQAQDR